MDGAKIKMITELMRKIHELNFYAMKIIFVNS